MVEWITSTAGYWTVAIALLLAGLMVMVSGWIGDRWRYGTKTPRCRRCRYDMSGMKPDDSSRKCPECGHEHKRVKLLHRPRKGWKRLVLGGLVVWAAMYLLLSSDLQQRMHTFDEPWHIAAIPDTVRIELWPWVGDDIRLRSIKMWASNIIAPDMRISRLKDWQVARLLSQAAKEAKNPDARRRDRAYADAGLIKLHYEGFDEEASEIIRLGLHDTDGDARYTAVYWARFESVLLSEPDLRLILEIAVTDRNKNTQRFAIGVMNAHAAQMSPLLREEVWQSLEVMARDPEYTYEAVFCFQAIDAKRALKLLPALIRDKNLMVCAQALSASSDDPEVWPMITDHYRECAVDREQFVIWKLSRRDPLRWQALLDEWQSGTDPLLRAKAERAIKFLKDFEDWEKRGDRAKDAPSITAPQVQPDP